MTQRITLSGSDWQFKEFYGEDWRWRDSHKPNTRDTRYWRSGTVPGSVHHDLWTLGEIPDPYYERNSLLLEWIPARTWIYKKQFSVPSDLHGQRIQLRCEGVDYAAEFFLNGVSLGSHEGMFTPAVFEVTDQLQYGAENLLAVVIEPAPYEQPQVSRTSRVRTHKSRMPYWWDFCPRMIHLGIWDHVYLHVSGAVRIDDVYVRPQLSPDFKQADLSVVVTYDAAVSQKVDEETILRFRDEVVVTERFQHQVSVGYSEFKQTLIIKNPHLWWPNGSGDQPLYHLEIHVRDPETQNIMDSHMVRIGIRSIELIPNEHADPSARPYTIVVNGRKLYIKGWNWVPLDVLYGVERPEKLSHLLHLARRANVNLLRVWGGGLIEREVFYDHCDEVGIMVWQEFIQSSSGIENNPPTDPAYVDLMVREAEGIIPRKRNHPSLVLWCGGNELSSAPEQPLDEKHPLLAALRDVVNRLDPDRFWLPTSPSGRVFLNSLDNIERDPGGLHDVHGPWEYQGLSRHYQLYNAGTSLLHSEFGVEGITNRKSLNATIAPEHQWPSTLDNPVWQHLGSWWNQQTTWKTVFGEATTIETLTQATQLMQAEGLRYALEANRRRKYQNSGSLPWQFNEPYPMATCTSAVDYYGQPKPAYYAVAHAYEPLHVSAKFPMLTWAGQDTFQAEIWLNNSSEVIYRDLALTVRIVGMDRQVYTTWGQIVAIEANSAARVLSVNWPLNSLKDRLFFLDVTLHNNQNVLLTQNRYLFTSATNLSPLFEVAPTDLQIDKQVSGDTWRVTLANKGEVTALWVWLEDSRPVRAPGYAYFDHNHFCLFPQETKGFSVIWQDVPASERSLSMRGWNTELRSI